MAEAKTWAERKEDARQRRMIKNLLGADPIPEQEGDVAVIPPKPVQSYPGKRRGRKSLRAYREAVDQITAAILAGTMPPKQGQIALTGCMAGAELLMSEHKLRQAGIEDIEPDHVLGDDGGAGEVEMRPGETHKLSRKQGIGSDGNPIEETLVEIEGGTSVTAGLPLISGEDDT